jgi:hypothetical protein
VHACPTLPSHYRAICRVIIDDLTSYFGVARSTRAAFLSVVYPNAFF